ncbi:MAG: class I SAM-dependent methyltransferase [Planctomycetota bacterium]
MNKPPENVHSLDPLKLEEVACPLCKTDSAHFLFNSHDRLYGIPGTFRQVQCDSCGLIFMNPRPVESDLSRCYPPPYFSHKEISKEPVVRFKHRIRDWVLRTYYGYPCRQASLRRGRAMRILGFPLYLLFRADRRNALVMPYQGKGRFLDAGCGSGRMLRFMAGLGWDVAGVEMDRALAEKLHGTFGFNVFPGRIENSPFRDESFDVVLMSHVLEHLPFPAAALDSVHRMLANGGKLYLRLPRGDSFAFRAFRHRWFGLDAPRHLCVFTSRTVRRLLEECGFHICYIRQDRNSPGLKNSLLFLRSDNAWFLPVIAGIKPIMALIRGAVHLARQGDGMLICAEKQEGRSQG